MALLAFVALGVLGLLGPRTGEVSATGDGYTLRVHHPMVTRGGLAVLLRISVEHAGGFSGPVEIGIDPRFAERLDFQNWWPNPSEETGTPDEVTLSFDPPVGERFETTLDARTSPAENGSFSRYPVTLAVDGREVASVSFPMVVMP